LPKERYKEDGCFFVGERGCRLRAREVICVNFLCERVKRRIGLEGEIELQRVAGDELETLFRLKELIRRRLDSLYNKSKLGVRAL